MAYSVTINSIDRTSDIANGSIKIEDVINDKQNICTFELFNLSGNGIPSTDQEIIITLDGGTVIFGGYIVEVTMSKKKTGNVSAQISCVDYTRILDRYLVHKSFENMTDKAIIEDIIATYCPGFGITTTNVIEGVTISQVSYNYLQISQVFKNIAKLTGRNWYIDYNKDIHYFPTTTTSAPFNITDSGNQFENLRISKDSSQLKNRVYVRGGTKLSDATDYITLGDGQTRKFVLPDKPHNVTVYVDTGAGYVAKTCGIKNIDTSGYDWYLNFQEKYLEQDSGGSVLTSAHKLKLNYQYDIPILVAVEDTASIASNGVQEFAIFDKSISTTVAARDRASAELIDYGNSVVEASFTTFTPGFVSGQYMNINSTEYDVNDDYIVQGVSSQSWGGGNFLYTVKLASAKTIGIIAFLVSLLEANKNLIELDDDEVVDELLEKSDAFLSDSIADALTIDSSGPYFVWADENSGHVCDSYDFSHSTISWYNYPEIGFGQSFTGDGGLLDRIVLSGYRQGSPTGNAYVKIYEHSGTFGVNGKPDGNPVAVSNAVNVASIGTSTQDIVFQFSGGEKKYLVNGRKYFWIFDRQDLSGSDCINIHQDDTDLLHAGNSVYTTDNINWTVYANDIVFILYTTVIETARWDLFSWMS